MVTHFRDPLIWLSAALVAIDTTIEIVGSDQVPLPLAHLLLPLALVVVIGYQLVRRNAVSL